MVDLLDPELHASGNAWQVFRELRADSPVAWCAGRRGTGHWAVTGHPELCEIARDPDSFSSWWGTRPEVFRPNGAPRPLHNLDPPAHGALRSIAARALFPAPSVLELVGEHLGAFWRAGGGDAVAALAVPLAASIFTRWMGLPPASAGELGERVDRVHAAGAALVAEGGPERVAAAQKATAGLTLWLGEAIAVAPEGSTLCALKHAGRSEPETIALAALFVEAGLPTTIDAISSAIADLVTHGSAIPSDEVPLAVEELLRRASPILQFARVARRDIEVFGRQIRAGQQLVLWFAAANRDERVFHDPDHFNPRRAPNPHLAFGFGPHRCIGEQLARRVLQVLVGAWPNGATAAGPWPRRPSSYLCGYATLPIRWPVGPGLVTPGGAARSRP